MKYNFIEIGTSFYRTEIEKATNETIGISIEPIKEYLDLLPSKPNVKKINSAISPTNIGILKDFIYYIPTQIIKEKNLDSWFHGCNSIGNYHPLHIKHNITHLVQKREIDIIPLPQLFKENNVTEIDLLKIDIEGLDSYLIESLFKNTNVFPKEIIFEANEHCNKDHVKSVIQLSLSKGYEVVQYSTIMSPPSLSSSSWKPDMILVKK